LRAPRRRAKHKIVVAAKRSLLIGLGMGEKAPRLPQIEADRVCC